MASLKLGKETAAKLGMIQKMLKVLRMHGDSSPFISDQEDSDREFACMLASPDYQKETKIATLNAEIKKGEAQLEWRRRSQLLR
jgi:hypothetical protein